VTVPSVATTMMSAAVRTSLGMSLTEFAWRKPQGIDL